MLQVPSVSVITMHKGRRRHLMRLVEGLHRGSVHPSEIVIVDMGPDATNSQRDLVSTVAMASNDLPLARARNKGRAQASGDVLLFLDVDCIPSADLVAAIGPVAHERRALVCCEIFYLPAEELGEGWREVDLAARGLSHPARIFPKSGVTCSHDPGLFWSLAFAVRAEIFDELGGFDEIFTGYGAEDTDLAFRAAQANIPLAFTAHGRAYHQYHDVIDPPLHHFSDIIQNAVLFRRRHGFWPMADWLHAFERMGFIVIKGDLIEELKVPTPEDVAACRAPPTRAF